MKLKKTFLFLIVIALATGCTKLLVGEEPKSNSVDTFEAFWRGVDETWPEFQSKHANWDSVYKVYRPQVTPSTSSADLQRIFKAMLPVLRDGHTDVYPDASTTIGYYPPFRTNYYGFPWIKSRYPMNIKGNNVMAYGKLTPDVGFIYIATFSGSTADYNIIDGILTEFSGVKGIIIDVRNNQGGNTLNSQTIASRFADTQHLYEYVRFRLNPDSKAMGDFIGYTISPSGRQQFKGKVAVLTNRYSFSATEDFVLMMKTFPTVTLVGDNTGGGSGSRPILKELPNGWAYRVSSTLVSGADKLPITNGIAPNMLVLMSRADSLKGVDSVIEAAKAAVVK
ncbi:MAG TPA: S41 family peptidase [Cyclobacteriaceae bacterium]|nr:S41 family peptidase [Cyclobacteriaceae bacterium]